MLQANFHQTLWRTWEVVKVWKTTLTQLTVRFFYEPQGDDVDNLTNCETYYIYFCVYNIIQSKSVYIVFSLLIWNLGQDKNWKLYRRSVKRKPGKTDLGVWMSFRTLGIHQVIWPSGQTTYFNINFKSCTQFLLFSPCLPQATSYFYVVLNYFVHPLLTFSTQAHSSLYTIFIMD